MLTQLDIAETFGWSLEYIDQLSQYTVNSIYARKNAYHVVRRKR